MTWLHTWTGLLLAYLLYFMFVTGTAGYAKEELTRWMTPERAAVPAREPSRLALAEGALDFARAALPEARVYFIGLPTERDPTFLSVYGEPLPSGDGEPVGEEIFERLNLETFEPIAPVRDTGGGEALQALHFALHYLPTDPVDWALYIVGVATMFMLVSIVSGIVVHRKILVDMFTLRTGKGQRSWLDAHNLSSVLALPFMLMITYSGLLFYEHEYMPAAALAAYGAGDEAHDRFERELAVADGDPYETEASGRTANSVPLAPLFAEANRIWPAGSRIHWVDVLNPNDANARIMLWPDERTALVHSPWLAFDGVSGALLPGTVRERNPAGRFADTMQRLHAGQFASSALRWLYIVSGALGAAMIATGVVLWCAKRRKRIHAGERPGWGLALVERLNVGVIIGLPVGIAAHFWGNRLLPLELSGRADREMDVLFLVWACALVHALLRPATRGWTEQSLAAAIAFGALPILNALTTHRHLGHTLLSDPASRDWALASVDLSFLALGIGFAAWHRLSAGARPASPPSKALPTSIPAERPDVGVEAPRSA